jgi:NAD(P)-dependent dehydrogenase (short-subunit alcohol dehydrogenase family)
MSPSPRLQDKRVLVTGAANGIGREFALHLAGLGAHVLGADIDRDGLDRTRELGEQLGGLIETVIADVGDQLEVAALTVAARTHLGGLDGLVNNAAIVAPLTRRPFDEVAGEEWDRVMRVNVKGAWLCARAAAPLLREAGGGSIVNLASEVAFSGSAGLVHYVTSKAAVIGLTRALARELGADQIRVNALAPGFIAGDGSRGMLGDRQYDTKPTPLGRVGEARDLLGALAFLISDDSAFVSGQTLLVNGGRMSN